MNKLLPESHPLPAPSVAEAREMQFKLMEAVGRHFDGEQILSADMGVRPGLGRPETTRRVEETLADFFGAESCALVQGAGTGAIRAMLAAAVSPGGRLGVHAGPPYQTTRHTFESMALDLHVWDYNSYDPSDAQLGQVDHAPVWYVQHPRHDVSDRYDVGAIISWFKDQDRVVLTDENYTVFKVLRIGTELGADASAFSLFKLLGPEGVGCVVGTDSIVSNVHAMNYSGGGQVQGTQALDALRSLVLVPVLWAIQAEVVDEVARRLSAGEVAGVAEVCVANAQDRMVIVAFDRPVARRVVEISARYGAQTYPVGANSRYEISPFFYRLSGAFLEARPELADYAIRVSPVRSGPDQVIEILRRSLKDVAEE